jgi:hypothetical protein
MSAVADLWTWLQAHPAVSLAAIVVIAVFVITLDLVTRRAA